jgi:hypothetical protein
MEDGENAMSHCLSGSWFSPDTKTTGRVIQHLHRKAKELGSLNNVKKNEEGRTCPPDFRVYWADTVTEAVLLSWRKDGHTHLE